ncbi:hypothetical protein ABL78_4908 [Leptomonas seymouri]|uniref:Uncharacterized protein n=1 Tax=Leptomonas seymouri TaxID=5684 RepID=A0A0N0P546_LEPSE|nr:hypothetical protein ABL78_4908 [Leptomonas seymouri]|eukprot:KPI86039.1 hypothetical protein ABL78_4908 [Leptomonas seymouri]
MPAQVEERRSQATSTTTAAAAGTTAAPGPWTMDTAMIWVVAAFYFAVIATAATYFVRRWRWRVYGSGSPIVTRSISGGRGERSALRGADLDSTSGEAGFIATIGAIIDRVMNRAALDGAAAFQEGHRLSSSPGSRHKPGVRHTLLRKIAPYFSGTQGWVSAATRNKEKVEAAGDAVEVDVGNAGGGGRADGSHSSRYVGVTSPATSSGVADSGAVPPSGMPPTLTARDPGH